MVYPTVGLESSLYVGTRRILRASGPQSNQSLDCEPATGGQGHDFQMFLTGCDPWYTDNKFTGHPGGSRRRQARRRQVRARTRTASSPSRTATAAVAVRRQGSGLQPRTSSVTGSRPRSETAPYINNNSCQQHACNNPNYYDPADPDRWALMGGEASKRVVFLFIVPYGAYKNTGPQEGLPILNFAAFYVTGWHGQNGNPGNNPCDSPDPTGPSALASRRAGG